MDNKLNGWTRLDDEMPPDNVVLEVADYAGRSKLARYSEVTNRFAFTMDNLYYRTHPVLWRIYKPPVAPTKLEMDSPSFVPVPNTDEPAFLLLARDPIAPLLVEAWAYLRMGQWSMATQALGHVINAAHELDAQRNDDPQILSAFRIVGEMVAWAREKVLGG